jgi:hypothetical protein
MRLVILGSPVTKKNHGRIVTNRKTGKPFILPSEAYEHWAKLAIPQLMEQWHGIEPLDHPFGLRALVYRDRDAGDLGNFLSAICDVMEAAGVCVNDKWIQAFDGSRLRLDYVNPRCELYLFEID